MVSLQRGLTQEKLGGQVQAKELGLHGCHANNGYCSVSQCVSPEPWRRASTLPPCC
jgi:hypothetical protein